MKKRTEHHTHQVDAPHESFSVMRHHRYLLISKFSCCKNPYFTGYYIIIFHKGSCSK
jgi:hypothetical protein